MNLLDIAQKHAVYRMHSTAKGGEWVGPCHVRETCGGAGDDRFHIWPEQGQGGSWWCRRCDRGGDTIQFLIEVEGHTFPEACKIVGKDLPDSDEMRRPRARKQPAAAWQPTTVAAPADKWREHAEKFVQWAHQQLLASGDGPGTPLAYLAGRGITRESAVKYRLGWNPGEKGNDLYRAREAWGLETITKQDGKKKKLWLPIGLVIPFYAGTALRRVRIRIPNERRTPEFSTPYYIVPGSAMDTYTIGQTAKAFVVPEAELDAILIAQECAGLPVGAMAMGNSSAKPTAEAHDLLAASLQILVALDYDLREDSDDNPGGASWLWWRDRFPQAERWPVPTGKDPGDAYKAGDDIRKWVMAGLPPVLTLPPPEPQHIVAGTSSSHTTSCVQPPPPVGVSYLKGTSRNGHIYFIADDPRGRARLAGKFPGKAIFTQQEILRLNGTTPEEAEKFILIKETFGPDADITVTGPPLPPRADEPDKPKTGCYWSKP